MANTIYVSVRAIDGYRTSRTFKTLAGAQRFAQERVGETPEISAGLGYAVSADGVVKVSVDGATLRDLFPAACHSLFGPEDEDAEYDRIMAEEEAKERAYLIADYDRRAAEWDALTRIPRPPGCTCSDHQMTHVGCACGAEEAAIAEAEGRVVVDSVWVDDIANPGVEPIFAVCAKAGGRDWVLTDSRALYRTQREARALAAKVRAKGSIKTDLWDAATMTDAEREAYLGPGGDLWQWEQMEQRNGNW